MCKMLGWTRRQVPRTRRVFSEVSNELLSVYVLRTPYSASRKSHHWPRPDSLEGTPYLAFALVF